MLFFGFPQPMFSCVFMVASSLELSFASKIWQHTEVEMSANGKHAGGPPRANEFTELEDLFRAIEMMSRKHNARTTALQERVFQEKRKTRRRVLRRVVAGGHTAPASQIYGSLVVVTDGVQKPVAMCVPQASSAPWLRLLMRIQKQEHWDDWQDSVVMRNVARSFYVIGPEKVSEFLSQHSDFAIKNVIVRDPVTRVLWSYLEACRSRGLWAECMSRRGRPVLFSEMLGRLAGHGTQKAPEGLRLQLDACGMRNHTFDLLGWHEDLEFSSQDFLRVLAKWKTLGENGWGALGDAKFSDTFPMDTTHKKVCEFYTPDLLRIVQELYADDFNTFGYSADTWSEKCSGHWAAAAKYEFPLHHHATTCMPTPEELHTMAKKPRTNLDLSSKITFFLHQQGSFDFSRVLACFLGQHGLTLTEDNWDSQVPANISEHLGEAWLLQALRSHPQRTLNAANADLHVLGALPFISYMAAQESPTGKTCGTVADHKRRMAAVAESLLKLEGFHAEKGRNFFIFATHSNIPKLYTRPLLKILNRGHMVVGTPDMDYADWKAYPNIRRKVVLPYKTHYLTEEAAFDENRHNVRGIDFLFHGRIGRSNEGTSRESIMRLMNNTNLRLDRLDIEDVTFDDRPPSFSEQLAGKYGRSRFCLVPAGDSPTSRRLFDALAGGCVPLALSDSGKLFQNLPFARTIDWTKLVFFGGSLPCVDSDIEAAQDWFSDIIDCRIYESSMRSAGRRAFKDTLSYARNGTGLVTALLTEIAHML